MSFWCTGILTCQGKWKTYLLIHLNSKVKTSVLSIKVFPPHPIPLLSENNMCRYIKNSHCILDFCPFIWVCHKVVAETANCVPVSSLLFFLFGMELSPFILAEHMVTGRNYIPQPILQEGINLFQQMGWSKDVMFSFHFFKSLYWLCYSIASVLCSGFLIRRHMWS